ncbi:MAG: gliding motility protein GldN [Bacteroidales bacterium]|jgi:gliding motility associated protien GldN|nr:gliding motility protein GldN [Bacteroidales bacterium]MDD2618544.1 gliding motility protein GldN [Bacteroidales bacterium]MDD4640485.1 gliding motility protein GldN [Bacteroidales bacterium]NLB03056.1 gliding motility protein GldN [Bacteroidales bacterium]
MKRIVFLVFAILGSLLTYAQLAPGAAATSRLAPTNQSSPKEKDTEQVASSLPGLSLKNNKLPEAVSIQADNILWQRDVYRMLDLTKEKNAPLYHPAQPDGQRKNLFSMLFELVATNQLTVYEYIDKKEMFSDEYKVNMEELLNRFWIPFESEPDPKNPTLTVFTVDEADIPSQEVTLYYVKESYFLDQRNSSVRIKTIAFCPVLVREDEMGEVRRYPLFWVAFDAARDALSRQTVSANKYNTVNRISLYDFFMQHQYQGEIYRVSNLMDQNIMDYCTTPEEIAAEQERLEQELKDIQATLWNDHKQEPAPKGRKSSADIAEKP